MESVTERTVSPSASAPRSQQAGARTRQIILATAERLFAAFGFDGVSMRQIGLEADVPLALVSYHFKSKLGLYQAVFRAHAEAVTGARIAQLESFHPSADPRQTVRDLVMILVAPIIELATSPGGRDIARLIARESNDPVEAERGILAEFLDPIAEQMIARFEQAFPEVDKATVHWAYLFATGALAINHAATGRIERLSNGICHSEDPAEIIEPLVNFATGGILAAFDASIAVKRGAKSPGTRPHAAKSRSRTTPASNS